jgi:hypothetical protein
VVHILAPDLSGFTEVDGVAPNIPDHALEDELGPQNREPLEPVGQVGAMQDRRAETH